ncbi:hypothetical protein RMSM_02488 [Rhodopirellula maiorica SM1]|uniref:Uncharacterized protein n=1 Tax=Rhodopirellula maiorica SM1 TaxID=1265738 RepID=M5RYV5_9BACT|nr:hypothetical protein RMSM_02488 [Rhodopirellula maiorica SM1]
MLFSHHEQAKTGGRKSRLGFAARIALCPSQLTFCYACVTMIKNILTIRMLTIWGAAAT